jgi:hypothetical protein
MEFYDFGTEPEISVPPASKVFDATPLVKAKLGVSSTPGESPPTSSADPTGGRPLSRAGFQAKVSGICIQFTREADRLKHDGSASVLAWKKAVRREGVESKAALRGSQRMARDFFEPIVELGEGLFDRLSAVNPPHPLAADYSRYLRVGSAQIEAARAETRALEIGDYGTMRRVDHGTDQLTKSSKRLAAKLGVSDCEKDE